MKVANLQGFMLLAMENGFSARWLNDGVFIGPERKRVIRHPDCWTVYGMSFEEMKKLSLSESWDISLVLGGPPFWSTKSDDAANEVIEKFGLPKGRWYNEKTG